MNASAQKKATLKTAFCKDAAVKTHQHDAMTKKSRQLKQDCSPMTLHHVGNSHFNELNKTQPVLFAWWDLFDTWYRFIIIIAIIIIVIIMKHRRCGAALITIQSTAL